MYKVLVLGMNSNLGGIENFVYNYCKNINPEKVHFDFLCNTSQSIAFEVELKSMGSDVRYHVSRHKNFFVYIKELSSFFMHHAKEYDAIWYNANCLANIDAMVLAKRYGIKKRIIHAHNSKGKDGFLRDFLHLFGRMAIRAYATDFWACSHKAAEYAFPKTLLEEVVVIKNAIDVDKFVFNKDARERIRKELGVGDKFVIGHTGRFEYPKNHRFLIEVFNEVYKKNKNVVLLLVGKGEYEEEVRRMTYDYGLNNNVIFYGMTQKVNELYQAMDCFVFPSRFEGLGIAAVEAQAAGLKTLCSDAVPDDAGITNLFEKMSLSDTYQAWAERILEYNNGYGRIDTSEWIKKAGYDIRQSSKQLEEIYFEFSKK